MRYRPARAVFTVRESLLVAGVAAASAFSERS